MNYRLIFILAVQSIHHKIIEFLRAVASYWLESLIKPVYWISIWKPWGFAQSAYWVSVASHKVESLLIWWSQIYHKYRGTLTARFVFSLTEYKYGDVCAMGCLQRCFKPLPCVFASCCLSGSYEIFFNVLPSNLCPVQNVCQILIPFHNGAWMQLTVVLFHHFDSCSSWRCQSPSLCTSFMRWPQLSAGNRVCLMVAAGDHASSSWFYKPCCYRTFHLWSQCLFLVF